MAYEGVQTRNGGVYPCTPLVRRPPPGRRDVPSAMLACLAVAHPRARRASQSCAGHRRLDRGISTRAGCIISLRPTLLDTLCQVGPGGVARMAEGGCTCSYISTLRVQVKPGTDPQIEQAVQEHLVPARRRAPRTGRRARYDGHPGAGAGGHLRSGSQAVSMMAVYVFASLYLDNHHVYSTTCSAEVRIGSGRSLCRLRESHCAGPQRANYGSAAVVTHSSASSRLPETLRSEHLLGQAGGT